MPAFPTRGIAAKIVASLKNGPQDTTEFIKAYTPDVSAQAVYKALRQLRKQGIVLIHSKEVALNKAWLNELDRFSALAGHAHQNPLSHSGHFLQMDDTENIRYQFASPIQLDVFWNHVLYLLFDAMPHIKQWYAYSSHSWFLLVQRKDELALRNTMTEKEIQQLVAVAHKTALDKFVAKDFDGDLSQYHMRDEPLFARRKNHLGLLMNVFGDFILEAQYDQQTTDRMEQFYKEHTVLNEKSEKKLLDIVSARSNTKMTIRRDKKRAEKIRRMLKKGFYIH
jgi:hypothetical protein